MSLLTATQVTAVATAVLAAGAIVTAVFAYLALRKQSQEVRTLDRETRDHAKLLEIQSGRLDAQREQPTDQQTLNKQQTEVLALQAQELAESMAQRKRAADDRHRAQAARVSISEDKDPGRAAIRGPALITGYAISPSVTGTVHNSSEQPIYDVEIRWHASTAGYGEPNPEPVGVILPGDNAERSREFEPGTNLDVSGAVVRFTDAAGVRWLRRPDGALIEQPN